MIVVHAFLHVKADRVDDALAELRKLQQATNTLDDGCLHYAFNTDITDPTRIVCVEEWRDLASLKAHLASDHMRADNPVLDAARSHPTELHVFEAAPIDL